jgi:hypothetical protein
LFVIYTYVTIAALSLAYGFHKTIYDQGIYPFDGDILNMALGFNFTVTGATGDVSFRQGDPATGYGFGDRQVGMRFQLTNFQPNLYCPLSKSKLDEQDHYV